MTPESENRVIYTQETRVFRSGLEAADLSSPVFTIIDPAGNEAVTDGNHRAHKAWLNGAELLARRIGTVTFDISQHEDFRPVQDLIVIDK